MKKANKTVTNILTVIAGILATVVILLAIINFSQKFVASQNQDTSESEEGIRAVEVIRVLLLNGDSTYRNQLTISCDGSMTQTANSTEKKISPGTKITISADDFDKSGDQIIFSPKSSKSRISLVEEDGSAKGHGYAGNICLIATSNGFVVINEVDTEQYLCSVVASESPESFPDEALKAQAVVARTYVYAQAQASAYPQFNGHVDDSVNFQAYQVQEENAKATKAVEDTAGVVLSYNNSIANTMYYSTSCGYTQDYYEDDYPYLTSVGVNNTLVKRLLNSSEVFSSSDFDDKQTPVNVTECQDFDSYIRTADSDALEAEDKYFRWNVTLDCGNKQDLMKQTILDIYQAYEASDKTKDEPVTMNKSLISKLTTSDGLTIDGFGEFQGMNVKNRGKGGGIDSMTLSFKYGSVTLNDQLTIRRVLGPMASNITLNNGDVIESIQTLYSSCFVFERDGANYILYGGGYGHGCGMSQYAASHMGEAGYGYKEILEFFYPKTTVIHVS